MRTAHFIGNARKSVVLPRFIYKTKHCGDNTIKTYFCYFGAVKGAAARRFCRALFATSSIAKIQLLNYTFVYSKSNQPAAARRLWHQGTSSRRVFAKLQSDRNYFLSALTGIMGALANIALFGGGVSTFYKAVRRSRLYAFAQLLQSLISQRLVSAAPRYL